MSEEEKVAKAEIIKRPAEQAGTEIKKSAWSAIFGSIVLVILGVLFLVLQDSMIRIIAYIVGAFLIIKGGFQIFTYYTEKGQYDFFNNGLLSGVVAILLGIAAVVAGEDIAGIFRIVIGVLIIYESLVRINTAIKMATAKIPSWQYILVIALVMMVAGIFIAFNSGAVITLIGWIMIAVGIVGIVGDAMFIQHVNTVVEELTKRIK
ncbi:DUF308 domain-containing protein [Candidatus Saccharibacteria bacterium]|nr:DUF308 domain-containing protein [Candidatus Saccharibacteria bacterium]